MKNSDIINEGKVSKYSRDVIIAALENLIVTLRTQPSSYRYSLLYVLALLRTQCQAVLASPQPQTKDK